MYVIDGWSEDIYIYTIQHYPYMGIYVIHCICMYIWMKWGFERLTRMFFWYKRDSMGISWGFCIGDMSKPTHQYDPDMATWFHWEDDDQPEDLGRVFFWIKPFTSIYHDLPPIVQAIPSWMEASLFSQKCGKWGDLTQPIPEGKPPIVVERLLWIVCAPHFGVLSVLCVIHMISKLYPNHISIISTTLRSTITMDNPPLIVDFPSYTRKTSPFTWDFTATFDYQRVNSKKTYIAISTYIYIHLYIYLCIYIYIYV